MKAIKGLVFVVTLGIFLYFQFFVEGYGTKLEFKGTEVYYTKNVTEEMANKLGNYLVDAEFADGDEKAVQLNKIDGTYQFRMVTQDGVANNGEWLPAFQGFVAELKASVFPNDNVELHLCDDGFETLQVVAYTPL